MNRLVWKASVLSLLVLGGLAVARPAAACPPGLVLCCNTGISTCSLKCFKPCILGDAAPAESPASLSALFEGAEVPSRIEPAKAVPAVAPAEDTRISKVSTSPETASSPSEAASTTAQQH
jgi:hypothetical protein